MRELFEKVGTFDFDDLSRRYFSARPTPENASPLFYDFLATLGDKQNLKVEIQEIKSRSYRDTQALVYVKLAETYKSKEGLSESSFSYPSGTVLEYIFIVEPTERNFKIVQVIPFYYLDQAKQLQKVPLPSTLDFDRNLDSWPERFSVEEIKLGEFLARR